MSDNHEPAQPETPKAPGDEGTESTVTAHATPRDEDTAGNRAPSAADDEDRDGPAPGNAKPHTAADDDDDDGPAPGNAVGSDGAPDDSIGNRIDGPPTHHVTAQGMSAIGGKTSGSGKKRKRERRKGGGAPGGDPAQPGSVASGQGERRGGGHAHQGHPGGDAARRPFHVGDQVRAKLVSLGTDGVMVDLWGKEQGVLDLRELQAPDAAEPQIGDHVDVIVLQDGSRGGNVVVTRDAQRSEQARQRVATAFETNEAIEGLVTGVNRGGLEVDLAGLRGFCPSSQIDARFPPTISPRSLVLTRQLFKVTSLQDEGREAVVSRRAIVETEVRAKAEEARANIKVGAVVKGIVISVKEYGVFVDLGGIEGMIHVTELTHNRSARPSDVVKVGDEIEAKVLRITGGQRAETEAPATAQTPSAPPSAEEHVDAEAADAADAATMAEAASEDDVEISSDASTEVEVPHDEAVASATGEAAGEAKADGAKDRKSRKEREREKKKPQRRGALDGLPRVVLSRRAVEPDPWAGIEKKFPSGSVHTGKVARMQPFGAFIELLPGVDGLLHVSELGDGKRIEHPNEVLKEGQTVNVRVERVEKGAKRIALSMVPEGVTEEQLKSAVTPRVGMITKAKIVEHESSGGMWAQIVGAIGKTGRGYITPADSNQPRGTDLRRAIALGSEVQVKVVEMDRGRPKLSIRAALQDEERQAYRAYQREATSKPVGVSLADKLRAKLGDFATKR